MKFGKINNRVLFLSPTVQAGWETESYRTDFQFVRTLGKGAYGVVSQAKHKKTGKTYAIKQIKKKLINTPKLIQHVKTQVKILYLLNHPHIIKLYNHFEDQFAIYFVLQFAEKGQLYKSLMNQPDHHFSQQTSAIYIDQICQALQFIHKHNVIHRDLKPQNILISKQGSLKLADFGWSNFVDEIHTKRQTYCGTLDYLAPQMILGNHAHDYRVDIWSVGVLIYQLCNGFSPFSYQLLKTNTMSEVKVKQNITNLNYKIPGSLSQECRDLISRILIKEPTKRISLEQIRSHAWIKKYKISSKIQEQEIQQEWEQKLKKNFSIITLEQDEPQLKKYEVFTNEQIYKSSRIEGILNIKTKQKQKNQIESQPNKMKQLQLRIKELQLKDRINKEQLQQAKIKSNNHIECQKKINALMYKIKQQDEQMKLMHAKIIQNQRKLRQYQKL